MSKLKRIQITAIAIIMAAAVAIPIVMAQSTDEGKSARKERHGQWRGRGGRGGDRMMRGLFRGIDLTDAQKAQLKQIRENHSQSLLPLMSEIRAKRQEIRRANENGSFNESLVAQKLAEIAPLEAKLMGERQRLHQEMLSVLTPEQKAKLEQMREQFKSRRAERGARKQKTE